MWLKKKKPQTTAAEAFNKGLSHQQRRNNEDTAARVKAVLAALKSKDAVVLAEYEASHGAPHEIRLGSNGMVFCTGKCWQYSKDGSCKHLRHFRANCKAQKFGRVEKE